MIPMFLPFFLLFYITCNKEVITTKNLYELRRPLRYQYYRLNIKANINPLISQLSDSNTKYCSSQVGPFCELGEYKKFMEYHLNFDDYSEEEAMYYQTEKMYVNQRKRLAERINAGEENFFLIASNQYKKLDQELRFNIRSLMYSEDIIPPTDIQRAAAFKQKKKKQQEALAEQKRKLKAREEQKSKNSKNNKQ